MNYSEEKERTQDLELRVEGLTDELLFCYEELEFIYESGKMLSSIAKGEIKDWKGLADNILKNALEFFSADFGWVYFVEKEGFIDVEKSKGIDSMKAAELSQNFMARVKKGILMVTAQLDNRTGEQIDKEDATLIFAPFKSEGEFFGAIALGRSNGPTYDTHHMKLLTHFSNSSAQALENARMFQSIRYAYQLSEDSNRRLKKLNDMKENFIAVTSHELKTPLSIITLYFDMLRDDAKNDLSSAQKDILMEIKSGIERLEDIVRKAYQVSNIDNKAPLLKKECFSLKELAESLWNDMKVIFNDRNIELRLNIGSKLNIFGDRNMIGNVLAEIILNAVKNSPDGGRIEVRGETKNGGTVVSITDSGSGISKEEKEYIFDKFYIMGSYLNHSSGISKYRSGGLGVGLAIVKGIVEAHNGKIWVESPLSEEMKGSRFAFSVPDNYR